MWMFDFLLEIEYKFFPTGGRHCCGRSWNMDADRLNNVCTSCPRWCQFPHWHLHLDSSWSTHVRCGFPWLLWGAKRVTLHACNSKFFSSSLKSRFEKETLIILLKWHSICFQFFSFLLVILVVEIAAGCWVYTNRNELEDMLQEHVKSTVENDYGTNEYRTATFDTIQKHVSWHHYSVQVFWRVWSFRVSTDKLWRNKPRCPRITAQVLRCYWPSRLE